MKKTSRYMGIIFLICALLTGVLTSRENDVFIEADTTGLTKEKKIEDFEYMFNIIQNNYPYLESNKRLYGVDWISKKEEYISRVNYTKNDEEFFLVMDNILQDLKNSHTKMISKEEYNYLKAYYEEENQKDKYGLRWSEELSKPKVVNRYEDSTLSENVLEEKSEGVMTNLQTDIIIPDTLGYLNINTFNLSTVEDDMSIVEIFFNTLMDYEALIIDLRGNKEGVNEYWIEYLAPMLLKEKVEYKEYTLYRGGEFQEEYIYKYNKLKDIEKIQDEELEFTSQEVNADFKLYREENIRVDVDKKVNFNGDIYVIIDGNMGVAAESFAYFCKEFQIATLVGEITSGNGNAEDAVLCALPNSGYVFSFSQERILRKDGKCSYEYKIYPDYMVNAAVQNDKQGDEAINMIVELMK